MSDFPIGGSVEVTRSWLDKKGINDLLIGRKADFISDQSEVNILQSALGVKGDLLNIAREHRVVQCFASKGMICNSFHNANNILANLHKFAMNNMGIHSFDGKSFYFKKGNLYFQVIFENYEKAHKFATSIIGSMMNVTFDNNEIFTSINLPIPSIRRKWILITDYTSTNDDVEYSNIRSDDICSLIDPATELLMIEDPKYPPLYKLDVYKYHLIQENHFPNEVVNNISNILIFSWPMYQRFNGWNNEGQMSVQVSSNGDQELRHKVIIAIESPERDILDAVLATLKTGSIMENNELITFVYVADDKKFEECLMTKYNETKSLWE